MSQKSTQKTTLWIGCTAHAIQDGLSTALNVLLPILAQTFGLSYTQVGLFKGIKYIVQAVLEALSGHLTERFGIRNVITFGFIISGLGYLVLSIAQWPALVLFSFILIGIGGAYHHAPSSALISASHPTKTRRKAMSLYNSAGDIGKLSFSAFIGLAVILTWPWQPFVATLGILTIAAAIIIFIIMRRKNIGIIQQPKTQTSPTDNQPNLGWGILHPFKFTALLTTVFLDNLIQASLLTFVAFVMIEKGISTPIAAMASVAILIGGTFGKAVCGTLADRIGMRKAFSILQILTALGLILLITLPNPIITFILLPFLGIVVQGSSSITYVKVADYVHPARTARGYSMIYATTSLVAFCGPIGMGLLADQHGIQFPIYIMSAIALISIIPAWFLKS